ncbi:Formamidopyrimidine-DNA glycosylase [Novipirellula artificiosorum]|uniref:Formamidopyrimidine-DNA glycosylase n=2 Tax=Novipirellula artificiosorum TaxID=2528016 RepID=A0A5C6DZM4_9BACT|nr:Formamidopyrimidine-DNA glycosylase [Novipirellula artificiosorum]
MRRGILPIVGSRIESATRPPCSRRPILLTPRIDAFDRRLRGKRIVDVGRRGKRVMIHIEQGQTIVIEPRMTGIVLLADPPSTEHLRLRITLSGGANDQLLFWDRRGLGTVRLMTAEEIETTIDAKLGVDALIITVDELRSRLCQSKRVIKVALLDQAAIAGVGNIYAAEILFRSGVDPRTRCDRLSRAQWQRITAETHQVLDDAIRYEGSTLRDGTYRNAINGEGSYQSHHGVYDRAGKACHRCCEGEIRRIIQAQRSTFFCPVCQRKTGIHRSLL